MIEGRNHGYHIEVKFILLQVRPERQNELACSPRRSWFGRNLRRACRNLLHVQVGVLCTRGRVVVACSSLAGLADSGVRHSRRMDLVTVWIAAGGVSASLCGSVPFRLSSSLLARSLEGLLRHNNRLNCLRTPEAYVSLS